MRSDESVEYVRVHIARKRDPVLTRHGDSRLIIRCQKRYLAREVFSALGADCAAITT